MNGSKLASHIDREYKRKKFYEDRKKKADEFLEKMVEAFVEEMRNEGIDKCN